MRTELSSFMPKTVTWSDDFDVFIIFEFEMHMSHTVCHMFNTVKRKP